MHVTLNMSPRLKTLTPNIVYRQACTLEVTWYLYSMNPYSVRGHYKLQARCQRHEHFHSSSRTMCSPIKPHDPHGGIEKWRMHVSFARPVRANHACHSLSMRGSYLESYKIAVILIRGARHFKYEAISTPYPGHKHLHQASLFPRGKYRSTSPTVES